MISKRLKEKIKINFNDGGYILDFGNDRFNDFTEKSIGVRVQEELNEKEGRYIYSKGKAFEYFIDNSQDYEIYKLMNDLFDYLSILIDDKYNGNLYNDLYEKSVILKEELEDEYTHYHLNPLSENIKVYFDNKLISQQIDLMIDEIYTSPSNAIGKAKNLVESCFKYILNESEIEYSSSDNFMALRKKVAKQINLDYKENTSAKSNKNTKLILNSLTQIVSGLNELRNDFGDGHGADNTFIELPSRYAELAVSSAISIVNFHWETYEYNKKKTAKKFNNQEEID